MVILTKSLRRQLVKYMLTTLSNTLFFLKNVRIFYSRIFPTKNEQRICDIYVNKFNEMLTNDVVNFERPAPDR